MTFILYIRLKTKQNNLNKQFTHSAIMYPMWMMFIFRYFDCWGFRSEFSTTSSSSSSYRLFIWFTHIVHIIFGIITTWIQYKVLTKPSQDTLGVINLVLIYATYQISYWISIIESFAKRKEQCTFWKMFNKIDKDFCSQQSMKLNWYFGKFGLLLTIFNMSLVRYIIFLLYSKQYKELFAFMIVVFVFLNRIFYYLLYLAFVDHELGIIERDAMQLSLSLKSKKSHRLKIFELDRFKWIRDYHQLVHKLSTTVNRSFALSNIISILLSFQIISCSINIIYWRWYNERGILNTSGEFYNFLKKSIYILIMLLFELDYILFTIGLIFVIFYVSRATNKCAKQVLKCFVKLK